MIAKKLNARALFYAILVSVFVAMISASMLLSSFHQHNRMAFYGNQQRLINNCRSGTELILAAQKDSIPEQTIDLFGQQKDSIRLSQKAWGLLDLAKVLSWQGQGMYRDSFAKCFFVGKKPPEYALQLAEGNQALSICGNSLINGKALLPREGIERGFINGKPFRGNKLVNGEIDLVKPVDNKMLEPRFDWLRSLQHRPASGFENKDSLFQSFNGPMKIIHSENFDSEGRSVKGHIAIIASKSIRISALSELENVLLIAPYIRIESGFKGSLQAFASDSLLIGPAVSLEYPSVLALMPQQEDRKFSPGISILEGSKVCGTVVIPNFKYHPFQSKLLLQKDAEIWGNVWVNGIFEHYGSVLGSVFCEEFLLQTSAAVYENYLLDAIIDRTELPENFLCPPLLGKPDYKDILKELK